VNNLLKTPALVTATKQEFIKKKTLNAPRVSVKEYKDDEILDPTKRICFFGGVGTGKTYTLFELLELGFKVFYISTDVGGGGIETVELECANNGKTHLLKNLRSVDLNSYEDVKSFLDDPKDTYPAIYDFDPDILFWDGFACFQQVDISEHVGSLGVSRSDNNSKGVNGAVEEGLQMETQHWGQIRNATIRAIAGFMSLHNTVSGKKWHKIVTAHEEVKMVDAKSRGDGKVPMKEQGYPMISGKAFNLFNGAFTTILRTVKSDGKYWYSAGDDNKVAKTRGFDLGEDGKMLASMKDLWAKMSPGKAEE